MPSDKSPLLACPSEIIQYCFGYLSWNERAKLLPVCKAIHQLNIDIVLLPAQTVSGERLNFQVIYMKAICSKLAVDNVPSNAALAAKLIAQRPTNEVRDVLAPYFHHLKSLSSVMDPAYLAPMAGIGSNNLKQQLPLLSLLQGPSSEWATTVTKVATVLNAHIRAAQADDMLEWMLVRYWVWRDILKAAIFHDHLEIVQLADQHFWGAFEQWLKALHMAYPDIQQAARMSDITWEGLEEEGWKHMLGSVATMMNDDDTPLLSPLSHVQEEHRALFWMWAIELGRSSISQILEPKDLNATSGYMLTIVACQLQLRSACMHLKAKFQVQPRTPLDLGRMSLLNQIRFVPDRVLTFNPQDVTEVMVAQPKAPE
ncbi:hypothetical protein H4R34_005335 [Dimargaris verticillata]|uniref:Uncharacterized protein n=1 Tax=Dimargaris verticillata TaxID=2761393 RepID=A0A9W8AZ26_9FUNG|nr:hypothetical protein H4R34_005335 [Dimargaris verticillata]